MPNTRSTNKPLLEFDSELEKTLYHIRKALRRRKQCIRNPIRVTTNTMATLRELTAPDLTQQPLCMTFPELDADATFELKSGLIHLLPKFHGMSGEDPNKHLSDFHIVTTSMRPSGVTEEQLKMRAFPFSLQDAARDWMYYLPPGSITTWTGMKKVFLEKYFPASKSSILKKAIANVEQADNETLYDYMERFKKLCASCPYHGYSAQDLILYFCGGMTPDDARMVHAASGGGIINKTPEAANALLDELAESSRHISTRSSKRSVHAVGSTSSLETKVEDLTSLVRDLMVVSSRQQSQPPVCSICVSPLHSADACPHMLEEVKEEVSAAGVFAPRRYDNYNPMKKDHPGLQYGHNQGTQQPYVTPYTKMQTHQQFGQHFGQQYGQSFPTYKPKPPVQAAQESSSSGTMSTEDMIRALATNMTTMQTNMSQFQHDTKASISNLENQVGQISTALNRLEARDSGKLPSQTITNPNANVSAITLRSGTTLPGPPKPNDILKEIGAHEEEELVVSPPVVEKEVLPHSTPSDATPLIYKNTPPFPEALKRTSRPAQDKDVYETFRKCEVNIPLLDLLKSVPRYAKFLKELCTIKRKQKLKGVKKIKVIEQVSAMFNKKLPPKCSDPGIFSIPCTIGDQKFDNAMLDLGASINVIPFSLYESLELGPLKDTRVVIQLADRSNAYPKGVVEDVLVMVDKLIFPADFYVLDMEHDSNATSILLGRPFLKTASTKIDVSNGSLTMESDGRVVMFNIYDTMKYSCDDYPCFAIDVYEPLVHDVSDVDGSDELQVAIDNSMVYDSKEVVPPLNKHEKLSIMPNFSKAIPLTLPSEKLLPSILQAPIVELQPQRKLNPPMLEVVKKKGFHDKKCGECYLEGPN